MQAPTMPQQVANAIAAEGPAVPRPPALVRYLPLLLAGAAFLYISATIPGTGVGWDETTNLQTCDLMRGWLHTMHGLPTKIALKHLASEESISRYWTFQHGHGPLTRYLFSAAQFLGGRVGGSNELAAARGVSALCFAMIVYLAILFNRLTKWKWSGPLTVGALFGMPAVVGHAHLAGQELLLTCCIMLAGYCFLQGTVRWGMSVLWALALTAVALVKIEGLVVIAPLLVWAHVYRPRDYGRNVLCAFFLSPVVFVLGWPWLWQDVVIRATSALQIATKFDSTYYWGQVYAHPPAPWHYPFVILLITLPIPLLVLLLAAILGLIKRLRHDAVAGLAVSIVAFYLLLFALPVVPKLSINRLFLPMYPFLAIAIGIGADYWLAQDRARLLILSRAGVWIVFSLLCWAALTTAHAGPFWLSYYNGLSGGGQSFAFQLDYWGESATCAQAIAQLNRLPRNATITMFPSNVLSLKVAQRNLGLRSDLRVIADPQSYVGIPPDLGEFLRRTRPAYLLLLHKQDQFDPLCQAIWDSGRHRFEIAQHGRVLMREFPDTDYASFLTRESSR